MAIDKEQALALLRDFYKNDVASIDIGKNSPTSECIVLTLDLTQAKTRENLFPIGFPFKSVYVSDATDASVKCYLLPDTNDSFQGGILLQLKDSVTFETAKAKGYLYWDAQTSKSITLTFFITGKFESGSNIVRSIVSLPSSFDDSVSDTIASTGVPQEILPADSSRSSATIENKSGSAFHIGQGSGGLTSSTGITVNAGERVQIVNTGQLLVVGSAGQSYAILIERN